MERVWTEMSAAGASPSLGWVIGLSYLLGSVPFGYLLARLMGDADIRRSGSGNIGATNVARVLGKKLGLLTLILDAMKGALAVLLTRTFAEVTADGQTSLEAIAFLMAMLGHCFPIWLGFRGGKGVATAIGALLAHNPFLALPAVIIFAVTFALTRVVSLGSILGAVSLPIAYFVMNGGTPDGCGLFYLAILVVIVAKHHANIGRLLRREESRFGRA